MSSSKPTLPSWVRAADILALALLGLALYIAVDGGFVARVGDVRLSFRSALTAALATRMIPVLTRDARRMEDARRCRPGGSVGGRV